MMDLISGFSKLSKAEKLNKLIERHFHASESVKKEIESFWFKDEIKQEIFDQFSENTITNFVTPYGVVPNFVLNNKVYTVPMVIEESSVVAACSKAAKFWAQNGGFKAKVLETTKVGHIHFKFNGSFEKLDKFFKKEKENLIAASLPFTESMRKRGGGLLDIKLIDKSSELESYYQLECSFETCDAMGANFINTVLEQLAKEFSQLAEMEKSFSGSERKILIVMSILSNYTPNCIVEVEVSAPIEKFDTMDDSLTGLEFCEKMLLATNISIVDPYRAVTHNKGIFNGIDAVVIATGNDFRAIEACGHAYAARDGQYRGLSRAKIEDGVFTFSLKLPISIGTVGGLTSLHPMAKASLDMLDRPNAKELMSICVAIGLAQNFAALRSLVTTGIQKGHMKMHLMNILNHLEANEDERTQAVNKFKESVISFAAVKEFISSIRNYQ